MEFARKPGLSYDGVPRGSSPPSFRVYVHAGRAHFRFQRLSKATSLLFPLDRRGERARVENNGEDETEEEVKVEGGMKAETIRRSPLWTGGGVSKYRGMKGMGCS